MAHVPGHAKGAHHARAKDVNLTPARRSHRREVHTRRSRGRELTEDARPSRTGGSRNVRGSWFDVKIREQRECDGLFRFAVEESLGEGANRDRRIGSSHHRDKRRVLCTAAGDENLCDRLGKNRDTNQR